MNATVLEPRTPVNDLVNRALKGWLNMTGLVVTKDGLNPKKVAKGCPWQAWDVMRHTEALNKSRALDPTGLTTFMLLRGIVESYLKAVEISAYDLILDPSAIEAHIAPMRELRDVLETPDVVELVADFQRQLHAASAHYGVRVGEKLDKLNALIDTQKYDLAHVRRDALISIGSLEAHQFTQGDGDPAPLKFSPQVFEFWNMNSVLAGLRSQRVPGISLCLIRDPEAVLHSYFIFAIRNGDTLTILTDREKDPHPAYKHMTRRSDRVLEERASRHWFPYQLLDLKQSADGKRMYANARTQLVPINAEAVPLAEVRDLEPEQFVWVTLMFDLIREKFWAKNTRAKALSYTGQMVVEPHSLVGPAGALATRRSGAYKPLALAPLKAADVTAETTRKQWERAPTGFNRWMTERYAAKVPDAVLNTVGENAKLLLEAKVKSGKLLGIKKHKSGEEIEPVRLQTLAPVTFGTARDIVRDRLWVARMNQAEVIQRLANEEYVREREKVLAWYRAAVKKNLPMLLDVCARGELRLPIWEPSQFAARATSRFVEKDVLLQSVGNRFGDWWPETVFGEYHADVEVLRAWPRRRTRTTRWFSCAVNLGSKASVFTCIPPNCPQALAVLCGTTVENLPWPLQHWYVGEPYNGNCSLDRLDPEDWKLNNPWVHDSHAGTEGVRLSVGIALSKAAFHERRKVLGLPRKELKAEPKEERK